MHAAQAPALREGEGGLNPEQIGFVHPHLRPPPSEGEDIIGEISNIFG